MNNVLATIQIYAVMAVIALVTVGCASIALLSSVGESSQLYFLLLVLLMFALLAPLVSMLHRPGFHSGAAVLSALFLAIIALLSLAVFEWIDGSSKFWNSFMILLATGIPAGVALLFRTKPWGFVFALCATVNAALSAALAMASIWLMDGSEHQDRVLSIAVMLLVYGSAGAIMLINVGNQDRRYFRWVGLAAALAAIGLTAYSLWNKQDWNDSLNFFARLCGLLTFTLALVNMILMTRRARLGGILKWIAIALACITGLSAMLLTFSDYCNSHLHELAWWMVLGFESKWFYRALDASLLLTIGSILCMIAARELLRLKPPASFPEGIS
jgi:hypothetical protein